MPAIDARSMFLGLVVVGLLLAGVYLIDPTFFGLLRRTDSFVATMSPNQNYSASPTTNQAAGPAKVAAVLGNPNIAKPQDASGSEAFADLQDTTGPASFDSPQGPAGCYPRDQLTPSELLPQDGSSTWAQQNPMGTGSLKGKNFLSAGALIGVNTVGQSLRNANYQLRSEPANPQVPVTVFNNSTIEPDVNRRDLEIN